MKTYPPRNVDATKILMRRELAAVLQDLKRKSARSKNAKLNLVLIRLACCCGLRASEIAKLQIGDVRIDLARPHIRIRRGASKGGRSRIVPLWWDAGTLADSTEWKNGRLQQIADVEQPFLVSMIPGRAVKTFSRHTLRKRLRTAIQSSRCYPRFHAHGPPRASHVYQPRFGGRTHTGRGSRRGGSLQREHYFGVSTYCSGRQRCGKLVRDEQLAKHLQPSKGLRVAIPGRLRTSM